MSRIGKRPIPIPNKVTVDIDGATLTVKGPKGTLQRTLPTAVAIDKDGETLLVTRQDDSRTARERHGLCRTLVANMVEGVATGFQKRLDIQGVGYRAQAQGSKLVDKEAVGNIAAKIREVRPPEPYKGKGIRYLGEVVRRKVGKAGGKGAKGGKGGKK